MPAVRPTLIVLSFAALVAGGCGRSPEEILAAGVEAFEQGKFVRARDHLAAALRDRGEDPAAAESFNLLGLSAWKLNAPDEAEAAFRRSRALNPAFLEPLYNLGVLNCRQGALEEGLALLREAAERNPSDTLALEFAAAELRRQGRWAEAQTHLMSALARAPAEPRILTALAISGLNVEGAPYAASFLRRARELRPDYAPALFSLGRLYADWIKEPAGALRHYREFLALPAVDPSYRRHAEGEVARLERESGGAPPPVPGGESGGELRNPLAPRPPPTAPAPPTEPVLAQIERARAEALAGRGAAALALCLEAAQLASSRNQPALELKALEAATALCPDQSKAHFALGRWYTDQGRHGEALAAYREAAQLEPTWSKAHRAAAGAAIECGEFQYALEALRQAVKVDPNNADALYALALFYDSQLRLEESARQAYDRFVTSFPGDGRAPEARARMEAIGRRANPAPAAPPPPATPRASARSEGVRLTPVTVPTVNASRTLTPQTPLAATPIPPTAAPEVSPEADRLFKKAVNHQQRGELDAAAEAYHQSLAADPKQPSAHYNLGLIFQKKNQPDSARRAFEQAIALDPTLHGAHYQIGSILAALGRTTEATPHFQSVLARNPDHALAHLALGRVYESTDPARTRVHYSRFLEISPHDPDAPRVRRWLIQQ
jgi:tetratricopeptide (TPR) repeat protein